MFTINYLSDILGLRIIQSSLRRVGKGYLLQPGQLAGTAAGDGSVMRDFAYVGFVLIDETGGTLMDLKLALKIDDLDNVATIFAEGIQKGMDVEVRDKKGNAEIIRVNDDIPYGHKIALKELHRGDFIMKYGECIGTASCDIAKGDYVHVHNLEARRGRGDIAGR